MITNIRKTMVISVCAWYCVPHCFLYNEIVPILGMISLNQLTLNWVR